MLLKFISALRFEAFARFDPDRQPVLGGGQWTGGARVVHARRVIGEVEVEGVRPVTLGEKVQVATGSVRLVAARQIQEWHEERLRRARFERVAGQGVGG